MSFPISSTRIINPLHAQKVQLRKNSQLFETVLGIRSCTKNFFRNTSSIYYIDKDNVINA
jgi:hypothetical protein